MTNARSLRRVGFWAPPQAKHDTIFGSVLGVVSDIINPLPRVEDYIDRSWDPTERSEVHAYVTNPAFVAVAYHGWSTCRVCFQHNGSHDYADGTFVWPEGLGHYIKAHGVKPPPEFVRHVLRRRTLIR